MTAHEMVAKVRNLPPVSHAALKLVSLLDQPDAGNDEVVDVLKNDSVLTAKLLRACNAPAVGLAEPVTSVDQAVLILGHNQIMQMVTALAFGGPMSVQLPGYAIESLLGRGGMAEVYRARPRAGPRAGQLVAVKRLLPALARDAAYVALFRQEAELTRRLHHPAIVSVLETGAEGGVPFLVMEYVDGRTLRAAMATRHFSAQRVVRIGKQIAALNGYATAEGIDGDPDLAALHDEAAYRALVKAHL